MADLIDRQAALDTIMGQPPEPHYSSWYAAQIEKLPAAQLDHIADVSKKVTDGDCISRQAAVELCDWYDNPSLHDDLEKLPPAQPEITHCGECIYYDPPHVENGDARYEYSEMPKEAFDVLGTGLVSIEYGVNIGGRCCVDYYCKSYSDDKRVYVRENNYCGRAERRTDG